LCDKEGLPTWFPMPAEPIQPSEYLRLISHQEDDLLKKSLKQNGCSVTTFRNRADADKTAIIEAASAAIREHHSQPAEFHTKLFVFARLTGWTLQQTRAMFTSTEAGIPGRSSNRAVRRTPGVTPEKAWNSRVI